jgi:hypothetical protein
MRLRSSNRPTKRIAVTCFERRQARLAADRATQYFSKKLNKMVTSAADVDVVTGGKDGREVLANERGTSLHDVSGWFPSKEFWIPNGTVYSDEIYIRKDAKKKTSTYNSNVEGYHYQLEPRTRMTVAAFQGALNNMARAAVVRQCDLTKTKV